MQLNDHELQQWEDVVASVSKEHIPLHCVKKLVLRLSGGKRKTINLGTLRKNGVDDESIDVTVNQQLNMHGQEITSIDFIIDVVAVAELIQPHTDNLLKDL